MATTPLTEETLMTASPVSGPIVVLGSVNMDLVTTVSHLPAAGETLLGNDFTMVPGGKGGNQAIAAARAGGTVVFIGAVGRDEFGPRLSDALVAGGVSVQHLRRVAGPSGVAAISVDDDAENTIVVVPGANGTLIGLTAADRAVVTSAAILLCQLEIPMTGVLSAAGIASAAGVPVLLNASPARTLPAELLGAVTLLVVNEGEAAALGAAALAQVPHVVTTLGGAGARYRGPRTELTVPSPRVAAVDTTGAGDAFAGTLAVAWSRGADPRAAIPRACAAGARAPTTPGASSSAPGADQIDALVASFYTR